MSTRHERSDNIGPESYSENTRLPSMDRLEGMEVRDRDDNKIGKVDDTYVDHDGGAHARYLAITTGWFGKKRHVIPVDDVRMGDDDSHLTVPYTKQQLEDAPTYDSDEDMTERHEQDVYRHYDREGYWESVRARQTEPAPTPEIAEAEAADAVRRGQDPSRIRVKRWGV